MKINNKHLIAISFLEGAAVMITEIAAGKIVAPYFGTSVQVWAIILSATLMGLALGYFTGGYLTRKYKQMKLVYYLMFLAGLFVAVMPLLSQVLINTVNFNSLIATAIIVIPAFLMPPIFLMGAMSPVIIFQLCDDNNDAGYFSGLIYGISTVGGILSTLIFGIFILPNLGVVKPMYITGSVLMVIAVLFLLKGNRKNALLFAVVPLMLLCSASYFKEKSSRVKEHYSSSDMMGQLKVIDFKGNRFMLLDNTVQAAQILSRPDYNFVHFMDALDAIFSNKIIEGKRALIFGLGGGLFARQLSNKHNIEVTAVEIDDRVEPLARKYFKLPNEVKVINMDARNYINTFSDEKYDIIMFDTFLGEYLPSHLFTKESLLKVKNMLNSDGVIITDFNGYFEGKKGKGSRSIIKTLEALNFKSIVMGTAPENTFKRSLLFFSTLSESAFQKLSEIKNVQHKRIHVVPYNDSTLSDAVILSDKNLQLDMLTNELGIEWRQYMQKTMLKELREGGYVLID